MRTTMNKIRSILLAGVVALSLTACGGSDSSSPAATTASKTALWANVSVAAGNKQVTLSWDKPTSSSSSASSTTSTTSTYNIYWSNTPGVTKTTKDVNIIKNVTSPYQHTGLTNDRAYYYVVTEVSASNVEGPESQEVMATPQAALPAPPALKVTAGDSKVTLDLASGTAPTGTLYNIYWNNTGNVTTGSTNFIKNISLPYIHTGLTNAAVYYYVVSAVTSQGEGVPSKQFTVLPLAAIKQLSVTAKGLPFGTYTTVTTDGTPAIPTAPVITAGNQKVTLNWTPAVTTSDTLDIVKIPGNKKTFLQTDSGLSYSYNLYWDTKPITAITASTPKISIPGLTTNTFTHSALTNGTQYFYALTTVATIIDPLYAFLNATYESDFRNFSQLSAIPTPSTTAAPAGFSGVTGSNQVSLSWQKDSSGIANIFYNVYALASNNAVSVSDVYKVANRIGTTSSNSFVHSGLTTPGMKYNYVVTTVAEAESDPSTLLSFTFPK